MVEPFVRGAVPGLLLGGHEWSEADGQLERCKHWLDGRFSVRARGSTVGRELRAGLVTWVTMSYIVVVNPMILSAATPDGGAALPFRASLVGTCLTAAVATAYVGLGANLPFGLAAGMGLNSYFRYSVLAKFGLSPAAGLAACFTQAVLFAGLTVIGAVDLVQNALPRGLKCSITVGIGIFQALVGFQMMGLVAKDDETFVTLGDLSQPKLWLTMATTLLVAVLLIRKTKGALILGIGFATVALRVLGTEDASAVTSTVVGSSASDAIVPGLDFDAAFHSPQAFFTATFCMLFIVIFDTAGVQYAIGCQAGLLDSEDKLPGAKNAYLASSLGTGLGAFLGTSPVIIHNESAAGVAEGGRTGLCAVATAVLFLFSPVLVPLIELVPIEATAPCLVLVGALMMGPVGQIDYSDLKAGLPSFLVISITPLTYSISAGIFAGMAAHFLLTAILSVAEAAERAGDAVGDAAEERFSKYRPSSLIMSCDRSMEATSFVL